MSRLLMAFVALAAAVVMMGLSTTSAFGAGITFSTTTTTATASLITLNESSLGSVIGGRTLSLSLVASATCNGTNLVTIGTVTGGRGVISSPAGYTMSLLPPWSIATRCEFVGGSLKVYVLGARLTWTAGFLGTYTYTGELSANLNAAGTSLSGVSSAFRSDRSTTLSYGTPWAFALSPSVGWRLVP